MVAKGEFLFRDDEAFLKLAMMMVSKYVNILKTILVCTLNEWHFYTYVYVNYISIKLLETKENKWHMLENI